MSSRYLQTYTEYYTQIAGHIPKPKFEGHKTNIGIGDRIENESARCLKIGSTEKRRIVTYYVFSTISFRESQR